jgi:hypothetical protein
MLALLPERERVIVHLRFLDELTQSEIAASVGLSQMHDELGRVDATRAVAARDPTARARRASAGMSAPEVRLPVALQRRGATAAPAVDASGASAPTGAHP